MAVKTYTADPRAPISATWWAIGLRGLTAVLFGILTFVMPALTLGFLAILFGMYALLDGILNIVTALRTPAAHDHRLAMFFVGFAGLITGVLTLMYPGITALVLLYFIASWAIITGIAQIVAAVRLRKVISGEWLFILCGVLSVLFGIALYMAPGAGALALVLWIGVYALIVGSMLMVLAFRMRSWAREVDNLRNQHA